MKHPKNSRRVFIKNSATLAALATAGPMLNRSSVFAAPKPDKNMINALQVGANSFVEEGVEQVLDILQKRGAVNSVFLNTFTYGGGLAGSEAAWQLVRSGIPVVLHER